MENPWIELPEIGPFSVAQDHLRIAAFNQLADDAHKIHLEILPEPFIGNPEAKVLLLNLNPGYKPADLHFHTNEEYFIRSLRKNLRHENQEYPFYPLDPRNFDSPASRYWRRRLRPLIEERGLRKVASGVLCVEFFPYHSRKYKRVGSSILASQHYSFHLVREAMKRRAAIVFMRSEKRWRSNVPELDDYRTLRIRSWQNPTISRKNLPDGFEGLIRLLE